MFEHQHFDHIILAGGYTDMRSGLNQLASIVQDSFEMNPFNNSLFLFCGRRADRIKCIYWEKSGFVMTYKRLEGGRFRWPRKEFAPIDISEQQLGWLLEGLSIYQSPMYRDLDNPILV